MSHTFKVSDNVVSDWVKKSTERKPFLEHHGIKRKVEGESLYHSKVDTVGGLSPFFNAFSHAFNNHCPLIITPDGVWLTILNGLCHHIDTDPEGLRHHFVEHKGKAKIEIKRGAVNWQNADDSFWNGIIVSDSDSFSNQIKNHIGKKHDLIVCDFSTSTLTDKVSSSVALMGAMKHFFEYKMMFACGLSNVTVTGTPEDWGNISDRVRALSELGLGWWTDQLLPVIDQMRLACEGKPEIDFWTRAYLKHRKGSGGDYDVSGWINTFFPYLAGSSPNQMVQNKFVDWEANHGSGYPGVDSKDFPFGMVSAPVEINDHGDIHNCKFYGGLVGVSMAEDYSVKAESGISIQLLAAEKEQEVTLV